MISVWNNQHTWHSQLKRKFKTERAPLINNEEVKRVKEKFRQARSLKTPEESTSTCPKRLKPSLVSPLNLTKAKARSHCYIVYIWSVTSDICFDKGIMHCGGGCNLCWGSYQGTAWAIQKVASRHESGERPHDENLCMETPRNSRRNVNWRSVEEISIPKNIRWGKNN